MSSLDNLSFDMPWKPFRSNANCAIVNNTLYLDGDFNSSNPHSHELSEDFRHFLLETFQLLPNVITRIVLWDNFISNNLSFIKRHAWLFFKDAPVEVSPRNLYFTEIDGVIYDAAKTILFYCYDLATSCSIPDHVTRIEFGAFDNCKQLQHISNTGELKHVPRNAFCDCAALEDEIVVDHRLMWVPNNATSYEIPDDVRGIDGKAFKYCEKLQHLTISDGIKMIPDSLFEDCKSLKDEVVFGQKLLCAPKTCQFYSIPDGVKEICRMAFKHCIALKQLTIPDSVEVIYDGAFYDCISLEHDIVFNQKLYCAPKTVECYVVPDNVTDIDMRAFKTCQNLKDVTIPGSVKVICGYLFNDCKGLRSVTIGEGVEKIGDRSFEGCKLSDVTLPASLKELDAWAFRECPLQTLTFLGTTPPKKTGAPVVEYGDDYICLVRVPKGSKAAYEKLFPDFDFDLEEYEP